MVELFVKVIGGENGEPSSFKRFITGTDIRQIAGDAAVSWIKSDNAVDVLGSDPYEELAVDVRKGRFDLQSLKVTMEELRDEHGKCSLQQIRIRATELYQKPEPKEVLTGWELS